MNKSGKNTKIIKSLIIVFVLVILIVVGCIVFLTTDLFKSNKTLFTKSAIQLMGTENSFIENSVIDYYAKFTKTPFENETMLTFSAEGADEETTKIINQINITLNGKASIKDKIADETLSINYSPEVKLPFNLRYKNNLFGYQSDYISSKYMVDDRNKTSPISLSNKTEVDNEITQEDIKNILSKYGQIILENIPEDKFSKEESGTNKAYKLTLTMKDVYDLEKSVLEAMRQDDDTKSKLDLNDQKIESLIENADEEINDPNNQNTNIEVLLYRNSGNVSKIEVKTEEQKISLEKTNQNNNLQYKLLFSTSINKSTLIEAELTLSYNGLDNMQNIEDNYALKLVVSDSQSDMSVSNITYVLNNKVTFLDSIEVEEFNNDNATIYSNYDYEQINTLTQNISDRMTQVNQMQMEQLGLDESQNPLEIVATPVEAILIANRKSKSIFIPAKTQEMDNQSILTFNAKFENYAGTNIQGTTVRGLLTTISSNNGISDNEEINSGISTTSSRKIEEINFNGEEFEVNGQNIAALKEEIVPTNYYKVEFEKNQTTGAIYRVVINNK